MACQMCQTPSPTNSQPPIHLIISINNMLMRVSSLSSFSPKCQSQSWRSATSNSKKAHAYPPPASALASSLSYTVMPLSLSPSQSSCPVNRDDVNCKHWYLCSLRTPHRPRRRGALAGNVANMSRHVSTIWHVAPILAKWVRVVKTTLKMLW